MNDIAERGRQMKKLKAARAIKVATRTLARWEAGETKPKGVYLKAAEAYVALYRARGGKRFSG